MDSMRETRMNDMMLDLGGGCSSEDGELMRINEMRRTKRYERDTGDDSDERNALDDVD